MTRDPRSRLTEQQVQDAIAMRRSGVSMDELGTIFGVSRQTIHRYLTRSGVVSRPLARHGLTKSHKQEYDRWAGIKSRCFNANHHAYARYGGRGITVCQRWRNSFEAFLADTGIPSRSKRSFDRIDNDGGYWCGKPECEECGPLNRTPNWQWTTPKEQSINRHNTIIVTYQGKAKTIGEWSQISGLPPRLIYNRYKLCDSRNLLSPKASGRHMAGMSMMTRTKRLWYAMVQRCTNPKCANYQFYGARGITVCDRWLTFSQFLFDMGERPSLDHSLDRIDNTKGYEPGNLRWATFKEQYANRRPRGTARAKN